MYMYITPKHTEYNFTNIKIENLYIYMYLCFNREYLLVKVDTRWEYILLITFPFLTKMIYCTYSIDYLV